MSAFKRANPDDLQQLITRFPSCRIAVVGDLMLDRYVWGSASRISQEAPVPVVHLNRETLRLGGAGNVAANIMGLGGRAAVFGTVGRDSHAENLISELKTAGIDTDGIVQTDPDRPTTVKTRVIAGGQQVVRVDREDTSPLSGNLRQAVMKTLVARLKNGEFDALILEDYAKGLMDPRMMQTLADTAKASGIITALDPHPSHTHPITGLSLMTPNRMEAFALAGIYCHPPVSPPFNDSHLFEVANQLTADWQVENLLITLGGDGMALFGPKLDFIHIPTRAQEVFDVSGAGDTVMASFVLSLAAGATAPLAALLSNHAAGIVVGKTGTVPVTAAELQTELTRSGEGDD